MSKKLQQPDEASELAQTIAASLDESLQELDELSLQRLKQARTKALQSPQRRRRTWVGLSAAASIALLLLAPVIWHQEVNNTKDADEVAALEIPPSAQELDDLEMLLALEDEDV